MARVTYFVVQPFENTKRRRLAEGAAQQAQNRDHAARMARRLAERGGAIAFARSGDPVVGEYDDPEIIAVYGTIPEELRELLAA